MMHVILNFHSIQQVNFNQYIKTLCFKLKCVNIYVMLNKGMFFLVKVYILVSRDHVSSVSKPIRITQGSEKILESGKIREKYILF